MEIKEVEVFDLYGNGTLVLKTNVAEPTDDLRYCWYVRQGNKTIWKGAYQRKPFAAASVEMPGDYTIRAYVRDGEGNKVEMEVPFSADRVNSPLLVDATAVHAKASNISGPFWKLELVEEPGEGAEYAWYLYQEGEEQPVHKGEYSDRSDYVHRFEEPGTYRAKLFVRVNKQRRTALTDWFTVK
jgi:hypothetical protein